MTFIPNQILELGAFGDQIIVEETPTIQLSNQYQHDPALRIDLETFEATGGSADNNANLYRCQTGTSVGGYGVIRSAAALRYRAGQGVTGQLTASFTTGIALSLQFAGLFSLTETLAFGYDGSSFGAIHEYDGAAEVQQIEITVSSISKKVPLSNDYIYQDFPHSHT